MTYQKRTGVPSVAIIILNWNGWKDTIECLGSLLTIDYPNYDIIVVDNGSTDRSLEEIRKYVSKSDAFKGKFFEIESIHSERHAGQKISPQGRNLILIKNKRNYGFAEGNNVGLRYAAKELNPDYFLLLNNDVVVDSKFLSELVEVREKDSAIGILGPKIYYYDFYGRRDVINFAGEDLILWKVQGLRYGFNELDKGQHNKIREVDKIDGSCMLIKREVIEKVGLLDSDFFAYWEETDFCMRAKRRGFKILYVGKAKVWHKIARTTGLFSPLRIYYMTRNRLLFARKHLNGLARAKFLIYFCAWSFWLDCASLMKDRKRIRILPYFFMGVIDGFRGLLMMTQRRKGNKILS